MSKKKKAEAVAGLRELANFLEKADFPYEIRSKTFSFHKWTNGEKEIPEVVRMLGHCEKFSNRDTIGVRRKFGSVTLQFSWPRNLTCKRVKVGTVKRTGEWKTVWEPGEYVEEQYEWKCPKSFLDACCE